MEVAVAKEELVMEVLQDQVETHQELFMVETQICKQVFYLTPQLVEVEV